MADKNTLQEDDGAPAELTDVLRAVRVAGTPAVEIRLTLQDILDLFADELPPAGVKVIQVAVSDEATPITTGTSKIKFRLPYAMTLRAGNAGVRASLSTAQATSGGGGIVTVDINEAGATILSTKLTINNTEKTSVTAATAAVISDNALADDAEITIDIDVVGDGTACGLKVTLIGD